MEEDLQGATVATQEAGQRWGVARERGAVPDASNGPGARAVSA